MKLKELKRNKTLYLMILPVILFFLLFSYLPMAGLIVAFKDYNAVKGIFFSPIATDLDGVVNPFYHFIVFFTDPYFVRLLTNTLIFSFLDILIVFPAPIILAVAMHSIKNKSFRRIAQTLVYLPYFISMVVVCGLIRDFTSSSGIFGVLFQSLGLVNENVGILGDERFFRGIVIASNVWSATGYGSVIYIAALSAIDTTLYEAAAIDGAGKVRCFFKVTLPCIMPTIMVFLLLKIGGLLNYNFEKIHLLYSVPTYSVADIFSTFVYRNGIELGRHSYTTAIGLFNSVVGLILLIFSNYLTKKLGQENLF